MIYDNQKLLNLNTHLDDVQPIYRDFRSADIKHSLANIEKARKKLEYEPTYSISQGLELTIDFYISNYVTRL